MTGVVLLDAEGNTSDRDFSWVTYEDEEGREWVSRAWGLEPGDQIFIDGRLSYTQGNETN